MRRRAPKRAGGEKRNDKSEQGSLPPGFRTGRGTRASRSSRRAREFRLPTAGRCELAGVCPGSPLQAEHCSRRHSHRPPAPGPHRSTIWHRAVRGARPPEATGGQTMSAAAGNCLRSALSRRSSTRCSRIASGCGSASRRRNRTGGYLRPGGENGATTGNARPDDDGRPGPACVRLCHAVPRPDTRGLPLRNSPRASRMATLEVYADFSDGPP